MCNDAMRETFFISDLLAACVVIRKVNQIPAEVFRGTNFKTSRMTLTAVPGSLLDVMFSGQIDERLEKDAMAAFASTRMVLCSATSWISSATGSHAKTSKP